MTYCCEFIETYRVAVLPSDLVILTLQSSALLPEQKVDWLLQQEKKEKLGEFRGL